MGPILSYRWKVWSKPTWVLGSLWFSPKWGHICRLGPFPTLCTVEEASPNYVKGVAPHVLTEPVPLHTHPRIWKAFLVGSFPLQNKLFGLVRNFSIVFCLAHSLGPPRHGRTLRPIWKNKHILKVRRSVVNPNCSHLLILKGKHQLHCEKRLSSWSSSSKHVVIPQ